MTPSVADPTDRPIRAFELYVDGVRQARCLLGEKFDLNTTTLADGHHELRVVATDATPIETKGRWIGNVMVKNGRDAVQLSRDGLLPQTGGNDIRIKVSSTTQQTFAVWHNGRELGRVAGGGGSLLIDRAKLGRGPVDLIAQSAESADGLRSKPLRLELPETR